MPLNLRTRTTPVSIDLSWEAPTDEILVRGYVVGHGEGVPDVKWQYVDANTRTFTIPDLREYILVYVLHGNHNGITRIREFQVKNTPSIN